MGLEHFIQSCSARLQPVRAAVLLVSGCVSARSQATAGMLPRQNLARNQNPSLRVATSFLSMLLCGNLAGRLRPCQCGQKPGSVSMVRTDTCFGEINLNHPNQSLPDHSLKSCAEHPGPSNQLWILLKMQVLDDAANISGLLSGASRIDPTLSRSVTAAALDKSTTKIQRNIAWTQGPREPYRSLVLVA